MVWATIDYGKSVNKITGKKVIAEILCICCIAISIAIASKEKTVETFDGIQKDVAEAVEASKSCLLYTSRKMYRFKCIGLFRDWSIVRLSEMHMRSNMTVSNRIS